MKAIKTGVFGILLGTAMVLSFVSPAQTIQVGNLQIPVANIQPVDSNSIPNLGTFYLLADCLNYGPVTAPLPGDCCLDYPVYSLGIDGLFLVDNTGTTGETIQQLVTPLLIIPDPNAPDATPIIWPVSLSGLQLVDPTNVPEFGTFYMYEDQLTGDPPNPPAYPGDPPWAQGAPVYALSTNGQFLVDDSGVTRIDIGITPLNTPQPQSPGTNLALCITGVSNYVAYLTLTNTLPGMSYDISYKQNLTDPSWGYVGTVTGVSNENFTPFVVPVGTLSSLFFWAEVTPPPPGGLWLEIPPGGLAFGHLTVVIQNTVPGQPYDVLTTTNLTIPMSSWTVAQSVPGAAGTSTTVQLPFSEQGNLFVCARFAGDSQGVGIPDWWQLQNLRSVGADSFALDSSGDGLTYYQDFLYGFTPGSFHTPPAPGNFKATLTGSTVMLTWNPPPGTVLRYVIQRADPDEYADMGNFQQIGIPTALASSFSDTGSFVTQVPYDFGDGPYLPLDTSVYQIQAIYANGNSLTAQASIDTGDPTLTVDAHLVRNSAGRWEVVCSNIPQRVTGLRLNWVSYDYWYDVDGLNSYEDIAITNLSAGVYVIPDTDMLNQMLNNSSDPTKSPGLLLFVQGEDTSGRTSVAVQAGPVSLDAPCFVDGREHMKQNLLFQLRAATESQRYGVSDIFFDYFYNGWFNTYTISTDTNYVESSYFHWALQPMGVGPATASSVSFIRLDDLWPFTLNYQLHYALYDPNNPNVPSSFQWPTNFATIPAPAVLGVGDPYWVSQRKDNWPDVAVDISGSMMSLQNGARNLFGLIFKTALVNEGDPIYDPDTGLQIGQNPPTTLDPGASVALSDVNVFFSQTDDPDLENIGYYFAPVNTPGTGMLVGYYSTDQDQLKPLPIVPGFSPTNQTSLILASVGNTIVIGGWLQLAITNNLSSKYAYLGQYFAGAYSLGTNGVMTTNSPGVLSPYRRVFSYHTRSCCCRDDAGY